jgi:hypothetical protein
MVATGTPMRAANAACEKRAFLKMEGSSIAVSKAQLRTLRLLNNEPARRIYCSSQADNYSWVHEHTDLPITPTLHRLFIGGYARIKADNRDVAVITEKGRAVVAQAT